MLETVKDVVADDLLVAQRGRCRAGPRRPSPQLRDGASGYAPPRRPRPFSDRSRWTFLPHVVHLVGLEVARLPLAVDVPEAARPTRGAPSLLPFAQAVLLPRR